MITQLEIGSMRNFVYLISRKNKNGEMESVVIDPQKNILPVQEALSKLQSKLTSILLTHTHHDHVGGLEELIGIHSPKVFLHKDDFFRIEKKYLDHSFFHFIEEGSEVLVGKSKIKVWHTPGHSAGECCFLYEEEEKLHLFTGDTVFAGNVGRTDLETGDVAKLFHSIQRIKSLPAETIILPGHNYGRTVTTTVQQECLESAAFQCNTIEELDVLP